MFFLFPLNNYFTKSNAIELDFTFRKSKQKFRKIN